MSFVCFMHHFTCRTLFIYRINRAWLYKGHEDSGWQLNIDLAQLVRHWPHDLEVLVSMPTGGNFWRNLNVLQNCWLRHYPPKIGYFLDKYLILVSRAKAANHSFNLNSTRGLRAVSCAYKYIILEGNKFFLTDMWTCNFNMLLQQELCVCSTKTEHFIQFSRIEFYRIYRICRMLF